METYKSKVAKKVVNILSDKEEKIERTAKFSLPLASVEEIDTSGKRFAVKEFVDAETAMENMLDICGQDELQVAKFFDLGRMYMARVIASNSLMGVSAEGETDKARRDNAKTTRKLIKTFSDTVSAVRDVMELDTDAEARKVLLDKRKVFAPLKTYFESLASGEHTVSLDFSEKLPGPGWFEVGQEDEDDEATGNGDEVE